MSETVARQRPSVDLDDFEMRLRAQAHHSQAQHPHAHEDDPLAELARIVGEQPDPYDDMFARQPVAATQAPLRPSYDPHGHQGPQARQEPSLGGRPPHFAADFAAIEAGLRSATATDAPARASAVHGGASYEATAPYGVEPHYPPAPSRAAPAPAARTISRRPVYAMAASIAIAIVGIGVAFAYKGTGSSPREIKTIMAATGPSKEQPPTDAASAVADRDVGATQSPTKLVSREEQPVDLTQAVQNNAAARGGPDAAGVAVPESPGLAAGTASPDYSALGGGNTPDTASTGTVSPAYNDQSGFGVGMPKPKRVKSVSVTPDGRIVNDAAGGETPPAISAPTMKSSDRAGPVSSQPPKAANRATRMTAAHRVAETQPADGPGEDTTPAPKPAKSAKKAKPVQVATAETGTEQTSDTGDDAKPAGSGGFAVQLAAPGSEADARSATSRLLKKFSGALHGRRLGFHRADSNGHTVYRVRVSSLSKEDATGLCSKLKADGGTCFVAKN